GKHFQDVVFRPRVVVARYEDATLVPDFLPARLGVAGVVAVVGHWICEYFLVRRGAMKDHGGSTIGLRAKRWTAPAPSAAFPAKRSTKRGEMRRQTAVS